MSPRHTVRKYHIQKGERGIIPVLVVEDTTNHPLDALVQRLEEALKKKGKKNLPTISNELMDSVSTPVYSRLLEDFPTLVVGEGTFIQTLDPADAAIDIQKKGIGKEELCLSIYHRYASTDLEKNKALRGQFLGVIADVVGSFWTEEQHES